MLVAQRLPLGTCLQLKYAFCFQYHESPADCTWDNLVHSFATKIVILSAAPTMQQLCSNRCHRELPFGSFNLANSPCQVLSWMVGRGYEC